MIYEYKIRLAGTYNLLALPPEMAALAVQKAQVSHSRNLLVPAGELLPQRYAAYLAGVLGANVRSGGKAVELQEVYALAAIQIQALRIKRQFCFEQVCLCEDQSGKQFDICTNKWFYLLLKQKMARFTYCYEGIDGEEEGVALREAVFCTDKW